MEDKIIFHLSEENQSKNIEKLSTRANIFGIENIPEDLIEDMDSDAFIEYLHSPIARYLFLAR